jgi:hypothetical protein
MGSSKKVILFRYLMADTGHTEIWDEATLYAPDPVSGILYQVSNTVHLNQISNEIWSGFVTKNYI